MPYTDPKTKVQYPSQEWMFSHIKNLPEVQKAYPERMPKPAAPKPSPTPTPTPTPTPKPSPTPTPTPTPTTTPTPTARGAQWYLSGWQTSGSEWKTQPTLTIDGRQHKFDTPQEYISKLQELKAGGATGDLDRFIQQFQGVASAFGKAPAAAPVTKPPAPREAARQYTIKQGDNLSNIARAFGTTVDALMAANRQITDKDRIYAGQSLTIPATTAKAEAPTEAPGGQILQPKSVTDKANMDAILRYAIVQKGTYDTAPPGFREQMIQQMVDDYGEQYRQFITDTVYRELRGKDEPAYEAPGYDIYSREATPEEKELQERGLTPAPWQKDIPPEAIDDETGLIRTTWGLKKLSEITTPEGEMRTDLPGLKIVTGLEDEIIGEEEELAGTSDQARKEELEKEIEEEEEEVKLTEDEEAEIAKLTRQKTLGDLREEMGLDRDTGEKLERPAVPTLRTDFEALRDEQGVTAIEEQINTLDEQIRDTEAALRQDLYTEEGRLRPMGLIAEHQKADIRTRQESIDALNRRKQTLVDELTTKNTLITNLMNLTQSDYANASADYTSRFNEQISLMNLLEKRESAEEQEANRLRDDSRANLNILINTVKSSKQTWGELDSGLRTQIRQLESKGGLPQGIIQALLEAEPEMEIMSTTTGTDSAGNQIVSFIAKDKDGMPYLLKTVRTGGVKTEAGVGSTVFQVGDEQIDLSTNEGLIKAKGMGCSYEEVFDALDQNTKMSHGVIEGMLTRAGFLSAKEEKEEAEKEKEITKEMARVRSTIVDYKAEWKNKGDAGAGTREQFASDIAGRVEHLTYEEVLEEVYKQVTDEWLRKNKPGWPPKWLTK